MPLALLTSGQTYFIHPDHLGTPQVLTDAAQQVAWSADYQPFGELVRTSAAVDHPLRFPGQYYDEESGLHYNTFRDYDPGTGRYVQSDPIGLAGGVNTYAYVENNPVNWADPKGLSSTIIPWAGQTVRPLPITPYDPALPLPVPDIEYIPGGPHKDPFGEECQSLARRIKNTRDEIYNKRYPDLDSNPRNLPSRIGPGEKLEETVRGHKKLLDRRLRELRELEDEYGRKCVPLACLQ